MNFLSQFSHTWHVEKPDYIGSGKVMCGRKFPAPGYTATSFPNVWPETICILCQRKVQAQLRAQLDALIAEHAGYTATILQHHCAVTALALGVTE
jgi:hypothetical protein